MKLIFSIDVEEEGLFSGGYSRTPTVKNVAALRRLAFVSKEFAVPLTLLTAYPVAAEPAACAVLQELQQECGAEIGAHLHHWNTPPIQELPHPDPVPAALLPDELLAAKLETLLDLLEDKFGRRPRSFRMGRFDLADNVPPLLEKAGIKVDSSLVPLRRMRNGPDHFLTPADPYWMTPKLLQAPVTMVPWLQAAPRLFYALASRAPAGLANTLFTQFRYLSALGVHPAWQPLSTMKWAARLHHRRGGRVLNMFLHSTEICPGMSPATPDEAAAACIEDKIRRFLEWITTGQGPEQGVDGMTLSELYEWNVNELNRS